MSSISRSFAISATLASTSARGSAGRFQREGDVLAHGQRRIERIALEGHGDAAPRRGSAWMGLPASVIAPLRHVLEAGDHAERRGLAAARRAEQRDDLARLDVERHRLHRMHAAACRASGRSCRRPEAECGGRSWPRLTRACRREALAARAIEKEDGGGIEAHMRLPSPPPALPRGRDARRGFPCRRP